MEMEVFMVVKKRVKAPESVNGGKAPFWMNGVEHRGAPMDEKALVIFQPDILIEPQYQATYRRRFHLGPEHGLMLAVLQDAVTCFQEHMSSTCKRKQAIHRDAEEWIMGRDRFYLFSFENVCEALGYDAEYMRQGLLRWKETALGLRRKRSQNQRTWPVKSAATMTFENSAANETEKLALDRTKEFSE
jgi:hypothetical protein